MKKENRKRRYEKPAMRTVELQQTAQVLPLDADEEVTIERL